MSGFTVDPNATNITATSHTLEISVHKTNWLSAQYIVEACDPVEAACVGSLSRPLTLIDSIAAIGYVKASNTDSNDLFGSRLAPSGDGDTLVVGARSEDSAATSINNTTPGQSIALSNDGNTLAVGAPRESSADIGVNGNEADNTAVSSGAVYVFQRSESTWLQQAYIKTSNSEAGDNFGRTVSLSNDGNTMVVGAVGEQSSARGVNGDQTDNTANASGAVYIY